LLGKTVGGQCHYHHIKLLIQYTQQLISISHIPSNGLNRRGQLIRLAPETKALVLGKSHCRTLSNITTSS
jgi:hypothetical protein